MNQLSVVNIEIEKIKVNPFQPRKVFDQESLAELAQSIDTYGIIQPISVRPIDDYYELVVGERRLRASKLLQLESIPAVIIEVNDGDSAVLALLENIQREDLNFLEVAEGYQSLLNIHGFTQTQLAEKIGKKQSTISNKLRVLNLTDQAKDLMIQNDLTERHGRALLKLDGEYQVKALKQIINKSLNVKQTEKLVETYLTLIKEKKKAKKKIRFKVNYKIYLNTIKSAYQAIIDTGYDVDYDEVDCGEYIEVKVKIPKN